MKLQHTIFLIFAVFTISGISAQESFFDALKKQEGKRYTSFYNVYEDGGKTFGSLWHKTHRVETLEYEGISTGIQFFDQAKGEDEEKGSGQKIEFTSPGQYKLAGYPNTRMLHHAWQNTGVVVIGDYIFELKGVNEDATNFTKIDQMYVASLDTNGKKIKGINKKTAMADNPYKLVREYLAAMKKVEDEYTLTESDEAGLSIMNYAQEAFKNEKQVEFEEHLEDMAELRAIYAAADADKVTLRNTSGSTVWIGASGSRNQGKRIEPNGTATWNCNEDAYFQTQSTSGTSTSYESTESKAYSAGTGCGQTIEI